MHDVVHPCCLNRLSYMSDLVPSNYDDISNRVRLFCAERLYELERGLRPWIDGSFGEVSPAHVTVYLGTLRELGRLYEAQKRPRMDEGVPMKQVEQMLEAARIDAEARTQAAVLEAETRVRLELEARTAKSIEAAKHAALTKLELLRERTR